jgi:hypothetical protein
MAGKTPFFLSGANAKIKLNGKTLAFCTDLSYSIQIITQTPKTLGSYEGNSVEPLGYSVSGSFSVIRYIKDAGKKIGNKPRGVAENDAGNGVGNWGGVWGGGVSDFFARNGVGNDGRANEALDPSKFASGTTFDIQVYQKVPREVTPLDDIVRVAEFINDIPQSAIDILGGGTGNLSGRTSDSARNIDYIGVANIRRCRITQADFSINKRGAATQRFNFVALYVDEDSFVADFSGKGQQL